MLKSFNKIVTEKVISILKNEKFYVENEIIQAIADAGTKTVTYMNTITKNKKTKKLANELEKILAKARIKAEEIRKELL